MDFLFVIATILTGFYAATFAYWLKQHGNSIGAWGVWTLVLLGLAVSIYPLVRF
ncbi:hypothetical protein [Sporomusa aerivorans]|uniref:hypothetical protein n=1 Tax=Sporomusa aerivorans TaxID=204936 RepID=UPI00352BAECB